MSGQEAILALPDPPASAPPAPAPAPPAPSPPAPAPPAPSPPAPAPPAPAPALPVPVAPVGKFQRGEGWQLQCKIVKLLFWGGAIANFLKCLFFPGGAVEPWTYSIYLYEHISIYIRDYVLIFI